MALPLRVSPVAVNVIVSGADGAVATFPEKTMAVAGDDTTGVEPLANFVAVTMHVPALLALNVPPESAQPRAVPSRTLYVSDPPLGSPLVARVRGVPT